MKKHLKFFLILFWFLTHFSLIAQEDREYAIDIEQCEWPIYYEGKIYFRLSRYDEMYNQSLIHISEPTRPY